MIYSWSSSCIVALITWMRNPVMHSRSVYPRGVYISQNMIYYPPSSFKMIFFLPRYGENFPFSPLYSRLFIIISPNQTHNFAKRKIYTPMYPQNISSCRAIITLITGILPLLMNIPLVTLQFCTQVGVNIYPKYNVFAPPPTFKNVFSPRPSKSIPIFPPLPPYIREFSNKISYVFSNQLTTHIFFWGRGVKNKHPCPQVSDMITLMAGEGSVLGLMFVQIG